MVRHSRGPGRYSGICFRRPDYNQMLSYSSLQSLRQESRAPQVKSAVDLHDKKVSLLLEACKQFHQAVKSHDSFRQLYYETSDEESLSKLRTSRVSLFGAYIEEYHLDKSLRRWTRSPIGKTLSDRDSFREAPLKYGYRNVAFRSFGHPECAGINRHVCWE